MKQTLQAVILLITLFLGSRAVLGQVQLVKDINPGLANETGRVTRQLSVATVGNISFFAFDDDERGFELWKSDGTPEGTSLVKDIRPGSYSSFPQEFQVMNNIVYFSAWDGLHGHELWRTDGTEAGTYMIKDIAVGSYNSQPTQLTVVGNTLFFIASDYITGRELWKSDGTAEGTVLVKDINEGTSTSAISNLTAVGNTLYLDADDAKHGRELWKSDGTAKGTELVKDILPGDISSMQSNFIRVGNSLYFTLTNGITGTELWKSDGTVEGTILVKTIGFYYQIAGSYLKATPSALYFVTYDQLSSKYEVWRADEATGTATLVKRIEAAPITLFPTPLEVLGNSLYFTSYNEANKGYELWKTAIAGTDATMVAIIPTGSRASYISNMKASGPNIYFQAYGSGAGPELWKTNGTANGTAMVKDINPGYSSSSSGNFTDVNGTLFFTANNGTNGHELWKCNGTDAGTVLVKDINTSGNSLPYYITPTNNGIYFTADTGNGGFEIWYSDGSEQGTQAIAINATKQLSSSSPARLIFFKGKVYFLGTDENGVYGFWKTDGTSAGTASLGNIRVMGLVQSFVEAGQYLYFPAWSQEHGTELWRTDGTQDGTILVKDLYPGTSSSSPLNLTAVEDLLYFTANTPNGRKLLKTDGTEAGTTAVEVETTSIIGISSQTSSIGLGNQLLFISENNKLWSSNGTTAGTRLLKSINPIGNSNPSNFTKAGGKVFFTANDGTHGTELWVSDGTEAGTKLVKDIHPTSHAFPIFLTALGEKLYFQAQDPEGGVELWCSDGTPAGTYRIADINPGLSTSGPTLLTAIGDVLYFSAYTPNNGLSLWRTDGTQAGTTLIKSFGRGFYPYNMRAVDETLFFSVGNDIWRSNGTEQTTYRVGSTAFYSPDQSGASDYTLLGSKVLFAAADAVVGRELFSYENALPTSQDNTLLIASSQAYTFAAENFAFFDMNEGDVATKIKITSLPEKGTLKLGNTTVEKNTEIRIKDIGALNYTPTSEGGTTSVGFKISDGMNYSSSNNYIRLSATITSLHEDSESKSITVFPNPSNGVFTVTTDNKLSQIRVFDIMGRTLADIQCTPGQGYSTIDLTTAAKGTYILEIASDKGIVRTKIVKQ